MKILLTGGSTGQIGAEFAKTCRPDSMDLIPLPRTQLNISQKHEVLTQVEYYQPDIVVNVAAYTEVDNAEYSHQLAYAANRDGIHNLATACTRNNIPLIHISSDYVFDGSQTKPYKEHDKTNPQNIYGKSKRDGEVLLRNTLQNHIILRTSTVFSVYGKNFVKTILSLAQNTKGNINVISDQVCEPTSAQSIAQTLHFLCKKYENDGKLPWGTYHLTGTPSTTWLTFARKIIDSAHAIKLIACATQITPISTHQYPVKTKRPDNPSLDCTHIFSTLGITQPLWESDLQDILKQLKQLKQSDNKLSQISIQQGQQCQYKHKN